VQIRHPAAAPLRQRRYRAASRSCCWPERPREIRARPGCASSRSGVRSSQSKGYQLPKSSSSDRLAGDSPSVGRMPTGVSSVLLRAQVHVTPGVATPTEWDRRQRESAGSRMRGHGTGAGQPHECFAHAFGLQGADHEDAIASLSVRILDELREPIVCHLHAAWR
jgi:hypothetical protein